ncbi:DHH family phosphoesterase [Dolosigranulum pigrum]|jgi:putative nucleotide-binding phosphoesterase|uniref:DHH family phosphoesterase n=2 Tax=Dolosigranulum pigrum TaxID=29394 RepID=UPI001AD86734|nr:DHH family phosphoesterase [Dolosigranulum pigrum]QTJ50931.1 hypothetical protein FE332_00065 [Dolosigranulum pigrum]
MKIRHENERVPKLLGQPSLKMTVLLAIIAQAILITLSFFTKFWLGLAMFIAFVLTWLLVYHFVLKYELKLEDYVMNLSYRIKRSEQEALIKMPMGIILYNSESEVEWVNPYLQSHIAEEDNILGQPLKQVHNKLIDHIEKDELAGLIDWKDKTYQYRIHKNLRAIYLLDVTEYVAIKEQYEEYKPVIGWLFLDNYDEVTKDLDDRGVSALDSLLTTYLSNWAKQHNVFYKKISDDRYFIILSYNELERLESEKFNIIDHIRERTSKRNLPLTISIGLAYGEETFSNLSDLAQKNLDLALGRGGDQVIVKGIEDEPRYYGGKTNPMEKRTRVRSRMISQALQEQIVEAEHVYIMGHSNPDMDAIGSAFGVARIAMMLDQNASVVINNDDIPNDIGKLLEETEKYPETYNNVITPKKAESQITERDLVILVDHHKPTLSIAPNLLKKTKKNVVIDHHRRGEEFTENPLLVYIEPYASSTAELITEFFEYVPTDGNPINRIEATAMLGGIIVDTNNFSLRTGSRTFDAASFLQSVGANITLVQRLLKEDAENYIERGRLIETIDYVYENVGVAIGDENKIYPPVLAAQTADTMLNMTDIEASFVITRRSKNTVGISARSLGKINVQLIMEKMGGGGHLSNAATQIDGKTIQEVKADLTEHIINQLS